MKKVYVYLCMLFVSPISSMLWISQSPGQETGAEQTSIDAPKIEFETSMHDFGRIPAVGPARHDFKFKNTGNQTLMIIDVKPSCGCTKAADFDSKVNPGEFGIIPISLKTTNLSGEVKKTIQVLTNVPGEEDITLQIKASIWQLIEIKPKNANFGKIAKRDQSYTKQIKILNKTEDPLEIKEVTSSNSIFQTELQTVTTGKEYLLLVTANPPYTFGTNRSEITLETNNPQKPKVTLMANGVLPKPIQVSPPTIGLPSGSLPNEYKKVVYVWKNTEGQLTVSDPKINDERISLNLEEDASGKRYKIFLNFPKGYELAQGQTTKLSFKTNDPSLPSLEVPVKAAVSTTQKAPQTKQKSPMP